MNRIRMRTAVMKLPANQDQLQSRLGLRSSSAAQPHKNKKRAAKRPGKGNRNAWKNDPTGRNYR